MASVRLRRATGAPARLWWSSLPLRLIVTTMAASVLIITLGGILVMRLVSGGILQAKQQASLDEASVALARMQLQLSQTDLQQASLYERLSQLAEEASGQGQYEVLIQGPVSTYISRNITASSVPDTLAADMSPAKQAMWATPTQVTFTDGSTSPGLAIGGFLHAPSGASFPIFFVFPEAQEVATLEVVQRALLSVGGLLLVALGLVAWVTSRQVAGPIRLASQAARQIAAGDLNERLDVRGTDDLASLATSMNNMASELSKQIAQLEDLSRLQQRFVSDVSHELRTPLTTMRMAADLLFERRDEFEVTAGRTIELLHAEIERFDALLGDLLEISRFDAGAAVLNVELVDLAALVCDEVDAQAAFAQRMGVEIRLRGRSPALAECDPRRIQRIVRNLLTNAIKYGEGRPVDVRVAANQQAVAIAVRDHGIGFLASQSEQVFHRFWRADPSRTRSLGGTGLGLAISQEDAQLHRGWLEAWGRPGRGALFRLTLPRHADVELRASPLPWPADEDATIPASRGGESA